MEQANEFNKNRKPYRVGFGTISGEIGLAGWGGPGGGRGFSLCSVGSFPLNGFCFALFSISFFLGSKSESERACVFRFFVIVSRSFSRILQKVE